MLSVDKDELKKFSFTLALSGQYNFTTIDFSFHVFYQPSWTLKY